MLRAYVPALAVVALLGASAPAAASSGKLYPMNVIDGWVTVENSFVRSLARAKIADGWDAAKMLHESDALRCKARTVEKVACSWAWRDGDSAAISAYGEVSRRGRSSRLAPAGTQSYRFRVEVREVDVTTRDCVYVTRFTLTRKPHARPVTASGLGSLPWERSSERAPNPLADLPICREPAVRASETGAVAAPRARTRSCGIVLVRLGDNQEFEGGAAGILATRVSCGRARNLLRTCLKTGKHSGWQLSVVDPSKPKYRLTRGRAAVTFVAAGGGSCGPNAG